MDKESLTYRFDGFLLDVAERKLLRGDEPVDLSGRYFDALVLLVREHGRLVEKDRFFDDVWGDVVVSDSALTQCIKDVRRQLGDDASNPRFIETVPRYGYRFIAPVEPVAPPPPLDDPPVSPPADASADAMPETVPASPFPPEALRAALRRGAAGTVGGAVAGLFGGLLYGTALAYSPNASGPGTASVLVVMLSLNVLVGLLGGFGVAGGMAAGSWILRRAHPWSVVGAALGGGLVGGAVKLLGTDAFRLFFGAAPSGLTGGLEGALLGAAVAFGARAGRRVRPDGARPVVVGAGLGGAAAGALIAAGGGRLMGGSLDLLARSFADSQLQLDALGRFFGEVHFGAVTTMFLSGVEGLIFGACVAGAVVLSRTARGAAAA